MSLKIGLLIKDIAELSNWELRIIAKLFDTSDIQVLVISPTKKILGKQTTKLGFGTGLLSLQSWVEEKLFFKKPTSPNQEELINAVSKVKTIKLQLLENDQTGVLEKSSEYPLDIIVNFTCSHISDTILTSPKHGVWEFMFRDYNIDNYGPIGFLEVLQKQEGIGFALVRATSKTYEKELISTAFFNRGLSMVETQNNVQEGAVTVFLKALKQLENGDLDLINSKSIKTAECQNPSLLHILQYFSGFYTSVFYKISEKTGNLLLGRRPERWSLFLGNGKFLDAPLSSPEPLKMPSDEFWADPFLFSHKKKQYVFFENYSYKTKRGKISCGIVDGEKLVDIVDVLALDYHLSFPYIFEEDGEIFLMPETSENERLEIYKAINFPTTWELYSTAFEGQRVADAFFYTDENLQKWLFLNKQAAVTAPMNSELYIYKVDSVKLERLQAHKQNPVIIDARVARNGGAIFLHNNQLYRPSQRNTDAIYGRALNINKIKKLNINEYSEKTERVVSPDFDKKLMAMHHLHQLGNMFVFDAAYKRK